MQHRSIRRAFIVVAGIVAATMTAMSTARAASVTAAVASATGAAGATLTIEAKVNTEPGAFTANGGRPGRFSPSQGES